jgi:hypothetical protein
MRAAGCAPLPAGKRQDDVTPSASMGQHQQKKNDEAAHAIPDDAWVAQRQISLFLNGTMKHIAQGQPLPPGVAPEALSSMAKTEFIARKCDYTGPVIQFPLAVPQPIAVATTEFMPVRVDKYGLVSPVLDAAMPDDDPRFRVDKNRPNPVTYIKPGHALELDGAGIRNQDGTVSPNWNPPVLRNKAEKHAAHEPVGCSVCSKQYVDYTAMKVHQAMDHAHDGAIHPHSVQPR